MTGEITLSGRVLPVGGIKEKVLAARRVGIREVILPRQNEKNVNEDLTEELRRELTIHYVHSVDEVLLLALTPVPTPGDRKADRRGSRDRAAGSCDRWPISEGTAASHEPHVNEDFSITPPVLASTSARIAAV